MSNLRSAPSVLLFYFTSFYFFVRKRLDLLSGLIYSRSQMQEAFGSDLLPRALLNISFERYVRYRVLFRKVNHIL